MMTSNADSIYCTKFDWLRESFEPIKFHVTMIFFAFDFILRKIFCCLLLHWNYKAAKHKHTLGKIHPYPQFSLFFSCRDKEKADRAQETVFRVDELTQKFQDAVLIVQEKVRVDASTVEASLQFMSCVEKMVLLQKEWSTKVYSILFLVSSEDKLPDAGTWAQ